MKRRIFSLLLVLVLLCPSLSILAKAESPEPTELTRVKLNVYSNKTDLAIMYGLYLDNTFYVSSDTFCTFTGAEAIVPREDDALGFCFFGCRYVDVMPDGTGVEYFKNGTQTFSVPTAEYQGELYVSLLHLLRYMGINTVFASSAEEPVHLLISVPYTIYDAFTDVRNTNAYVFNWSEADISEKKLEDLLVNAGVAAFLFHYDVSFTRAWTDSSGVEEDILEDTLLQIVGNEGTQDLTSRYLASQDMLESVMDVYSTTNDWMDYVVKTMTDYAEKGATPITPAFLSTAFGFAAAGITNLIDATQLVVEYVSIANAQRTLLQDTLLRHEKDSAFYQEYPIMRDAAAKVSTYMLDKYSAYKLLAIDTVTDFIADCMANVETGFGAAAAGPAALAWETLSLAVDLIPATSDSIEQKTHFFLADASVYVQDLARCLLSESSADISSHGFYYNSEDCQNYLRTMQSDMTLLLKSSLTTRDHLIASGYLTPEFTEKMQRKATLTAELLRNVEDAFVLRPGYPNATTNDDLHWIKELTLKDMGNTNGNIANGGVAAYDEDSDTYFYRGNASTTITTNLSAHSRVIEHLFPILSQSPDGTVHTLADNAAASPCINVIDGWVYYLGGTPSTSSGGYVPRDVYRMRLDGSEQTCLFKNPLEVFCTHKLWVTGEWIYFADESVLMRTDLNGQNPEVIVEAFDKLENVYIDGNHIYYSTFVMMGDPSIDVPQFAEYEGIWALDLTDEDNPIQNRLLDTCSPMTTCGQRLFYIYGQTLYSVGLDGSPAQTHSGTLEQFFGSLNSNETDTIYCDYYRNGYMIGKMDLSGNAFTLASGQAPQLVHDRLYFFEGDGVSTVSYMNIA